MVEVGLIILGVIIVVDVCLVVMLLKIGSVHDAHRDVASVSSSQAISRIYEDYRITTPATQAEADANAAPVDDATPTA